MHQPRLPVRAASGTCSLDKRRHRAFCADFAAIYDENARLLENLRKQSSASAEGVNRDRSSGVIATAVGDVLPIAVTVAISPVAIISGVVLLLSEHGRAKAVL